MITHAFFLLSHVSSSDLTENFTLHNNNDDLSNVSRLGFDLQFKDESGGGDRLFPLLRIGEADNTPSLTISIKKESTEGGKKLFAVVNVNGKSKEKEVTPQSSEERVNVLTYFKLVNSKIKISVFFVTDNTIDLIENEPFFEFSSSTSVPFVASAFLNELVQPKEISFRESQTLV